MARRVCVDFDGVIATYVRKEPFNPGVIDGVPMDGVKEFIEKLHSEDLQVFIHSSRALSPLGKVAIEEWCKKYDVPYDGITGYKIASVAYVDDRAVKFSGDFNESYNKVKELM